MRAVVSLLRGLGRNEIDLRAPQAPLFAGNVARTESPIKQRVETGEILAQIRLCGCCTDLGFSSEW